MAIYCYVKKEISLRKTPAHPEVVKPKKIIPEIQSKPKKPLFVIKKISLPKISLPKISFNFNFKKPILATIPTSGKHSKYSKVFALLLMAGGFGMILLVSMPIFNWQIFGTKDAPEQNLIKPFATSDSSGNSTDVLAKTTEDDGLNSASDWFPGYANKMANPSKIKEYTLSIPKLGIKDAKVLYGADDLTKSLINFQGTAVPGEYGNAIIFGHSVLPEFFDPTNYHTLFATLPTLKVKDEVLVNVDGIKYKYVIYDFKTVDPSDLSVLEQKYDDYYMSLITCVPPGLKWKRLVVKAKLEPFE